MTLNADFSKRVSVHTRDNPWVASPSAGVERRMLDRMGGEIARATTIVRFAPGSAFAAHTHDGGEEYLVLDGTFQDEEGDFPVGTYVRNPPTTSHTPSAKDGATILVKLWQFDPDDRTRVRVDTVDATPVAVPGLNGVSEIPLHSDAYEAVRIEIWQPDQTVFLGGHNGLEVFVIHGGFSEGNEDFAEHDWLRMPKNKDFFGKAGPNGARVWVKSGHLAKDPVAPGEKGEG